jgi:small conductance mechanosensitive channel
MEKYIASFTELDALDGVLNVVYKLAFCLIILIVGLFIIKIIQKTIKRSLNSGGKLNPGKSATMSTVCCSVTKYIIYFFMLCYILSIWGIDATSLLAIGGVASVAVGLGAQSVIQDILAGIFILTEDQFGVGDVVRIESCSGTVESVGMRTTRVRSADGDLYIIPNGQIKIVTNMSKGFNRAVVDVGISYNEDIDSVIKMLERELAKIYEEHIVKGMLDCPEILGVEKLDDSSVVLRVRADCAVGENWNVERELRRLIKNAFDREGIEIPFPQQVVYIKKD